MKTKLKSDVFLLSVGFIFLITCACSENPIAQYHMINVNNKTQGDAHYIKIDDKNILIDTGSLSESKASLVPYLKEKGVGRIDILYISHLHKDHYSGVKSLLKAGISISLAYVNIHAKEVCEKDCCCDWAHAMAYIQYLKSHGTKIIDVQAGDRKKINNGSEFLVLHAQKNGKYDINDTSIILLWKIGTYRVLFAGDLNRKLSKKLKNHPEIHADILKVPHHGTESLSTNTFIENVGAKVMTVPSPKKLWESDRSKRVRTFKYKNGEDPIKLVNGVDGHIRIDFYLGKISIATEKGKSFTLTKAAFGR